MNSEARAALIERWGGIERVHGTFETTLDPCVVTCRCGAVFTPGPMTLRDQWRAHVEGLKIDAALSASVPIPCETCGGTRTVYLPDGGGHAELCEDCTDGSRPVSAALSLLVDELVERAVSELVAMGAMEQVGWQYAHDMNGPLANLAQGGPCDDTAPVYRWVRSSTGADAP